MLRNNMKYILFFVSAPAWKIFWLSFLPVIVGTWFAVRFENIALAQMSVLFGTLMELVWIFSVSNYIANKYSHRVEVPIKRLNTALGFILIFYILYIPDLIPTAIAQAVGYMALALNLYCICFMARLIVMVEKERNVTFKDYISTAIIAYFWFIGIWFLQPRINRIYSLRS